MEERERREKREGALNRLEAVSARKGRNKDSGEGGREEKRKEEQSQDGERETGICFVLRHAKQREERREETGEAPWKWEQRGQLAWRLPPEIRR